MCVCSNGLCTLFRMGKGGEVVHEGTEGIFQSEEAHFKKRSTPTGHGENRVCLEEQPEGKE